LAVSERMGLTPRQARVAVTRLHTQFGSIVARDQEQEARGIAVPVIDAVIATARENMLLDNPVLAALPDLISPEALAAGEPIRAIDAYIALGQIEEALNRAMRAGGDFERVPWVARSPSSYRQPPQETSVRSSYGGTNLPEAV